MIHGVVQDGVILPLDPIPADWDGRQVVIEADGVPPTGEQAEIESWFAQMESVGPAQYEPGERAAIEGLMAEADRDAKEHMRHTWKHFDDTLSAGHESPQRRPER